MATHRRTPRSTYQRRTRLVGTPLTRKVPPDGAEGWLAGLEALHWLSVVFPERSAEFLGQAATPKILFSAALALLHEADRHMPLLESSLFWDADRDDDDAVLLDCLAGAGELEGPKILFCYAVGVNDLLDGDREADLLTVALWRLLEQTSLAVASTPRLPQHMAGLVTRITPLPNVPADAFFARLGPLWSRLLHYSVGACQNELANISMYELAVGFNGEQDTSWLDFWTLATDARQASRICHQYQRVSRWLERNPVAHLARIEAHLHAVAAEVGRVQGIAGEVRS